MPKTVYLENCKPSGNVLPQPALIKQKWLAQLPIALYEWQGQALQCPKDRLAVDKHLTFLESSDLLERSPMKAVELGAGTYSSRSATYPSFS